MTKEKLKMMKKERSGFGEGEKTTPWAADNEKQRANINARSFISKRVQTSWQEDGKERPK